MLVKYAIERGWDIYHIYCDEDYSGIDAKRPDFNRMLEDAEAKRFHIVLCKTQSRFTRDMELVEKYIHGKFLMWGIRFVAIADNVDTDVKGNKKARQINGLINEWYLEDLSENIRMVFDYKRRQGQYIGGFPLYGYQKDPKDKNKLVVDQEAASVVRQIYQWYLDGHGHQHIACMLNEHAISNPTKHKQEKGWTYINGNAVDNYGLWNKTSVSRILRNEMYTGTMVQGRKKRLSYKSKTQVDIPEKNWIRVADTHEAIIDRETFERVQELTKLRVKTDGSGEIHVLSGLVKCMDCGSTMSKTSNGYGENRRSYLRCKLSVTGANRALCTRHSIRLDQLIALVAERLRAHIVAYYELRDVDRFAVKWQTENKTEMLQRQLHSLEIQIQKRSTALKTLYLDKVEGLIEEEQFLEMNQDFLSEKTHMEQRKQELLVMLENRNGDIELDKESLVKHIQTLMKFDPMPRELFVLSIQCIEVGEKDKETGQQAVHIVWKF